MNNIDCIVSLTTWKGRINNPDLPKVLYSIFRQETKYKFKVVMTLSTVDFPNKEKDLCDALNLFIEEHLIEIIWVNDNTRALKKICPIMDIYPDTPILTTDDDIILLKNAVETFMNVHQQNPKCILTELGHRLVDKDEICTGSFRLFPPHSLYKLSSDYFMKYFEGYEDDVYMAILANLEGSKTLILKKGICYEIKTPSYNESALNRIYRKIPWRKCRQNLLNALKK